MQERASESSMEYGHGGCRSSGICDWNCRLVQPQGFGLQRSEYNGRFSLCRNVKNGDGFLWETGDFQFGSRKPVYQLGVCNRTPGSFLLFRFRPQFFHGAGTGHYAVFSKCSMNLSGSADPIIS